MTQEWTLEITTQEKQLLLELFESAEREMILGIDHSDSRIYRTRLQNRLGLLEKLKAKVDSLPA